MNAGWLWALIWGHQRAQPTRKLFLGSELPEWCVPRGSVLGTMPFMDMKVTEGLMQLRQMCATLQSSLVEQMSVPEAD